jgi:site-specific recombinase XerD
MGNPTIHFVSTVLDRTTVVKIIFEYNKEIYQLLKKGKEPFWSSKLKCWCLKDESISLRKWHQTFKELGYPIDLSTYKRRPFMSPQNQKCLEAYENHLLILRKSKSTIATYTGFIKAYGLYLKSVPLDTSTFLQYRSFIEHTVKQLDYSVSTHRQMISAFKHLMDLYPQLEFNALLLKRPKKDRFQPVVLSMEDIIAILQVTKNLKHRFIIALLYSCGLRIEELLNMKVDAIDLNRRQVLVKNGKGRKDRYVSIATSIDPLFINYMQTYGPKNYLIESMQATTYSSSSVRAFLKTSCKNAGILKNVTPHTLRHSYATHMLENGVGLRHIQELLGHSKPETTMLYTHIARKDLLQITNPLDVAVKQIITHKKEANLTLS